MKRWTLCALLCCSATSAVSIKHDMGTTELRSIPKRVMINSEEGAEQLAALGIKPVGYASGRINGQLGQPTPQLTTPAAPFLTGVPYVGTFTQPSQEQIARLKPDLILLTVMEGMNGLYNDMSRLAPTIAYNPDRTPWRNSLLTLGKVLGREAKAKAFLSQYDKKIAALRNGLPRSVRDHPRTTLIYLYQPNKAFMLGRQSSFAKQMAQLDLTLVTPAGISPDINYQEISAEALATLDTDRILILRKTIGGKGVPHSALDKVIKASGKPTVEYALDPQEADGGPLSDLRRLPILAALLKGQ